MPIKSVFSPGLSPAQTPPIAPFCPQDKTHVGALGEPRSAWVLTVTWRDRQGPGLRETRPLHLATPTKLGPKLPLLALGEAGAKIIAQFLFCFVLFSWELQREVCGIRVDPRPGGRGSLRAPAQRLHPQPKSALGAQDQLRLPARLCVVGQDAEAQQREGQDHLYLGHGEVLPDAVPGSR